VIKEKIREGPFIIGAPKGTILQEGPLDDSSILTLTQEKTPLEVLGLGPNRTLRVKFSKIEGLTTKLPTEVFYLALPELNHFPS
jgi:hypothetical protein